MFGRRFLNNYWDIRYLYYNIIEIIKEKARKSEWTYEEEEKLVTNSPRWEYDEDTETVKFK